MRSLTAKEREIAAACAEAYPLGWGYSFLALEHPMGGRFGGPMLTANYLRSHPEAAEHG